MPIPVNEIPIFYACDQGFIKFCTVSLQSMIQNASRNCFYRVYVLHTDVTPKMQEAVRRVENECFAIEFVNVSAYLNSAASKMPIRDYYSKTTYYRLYIAEMFPQLQKAIYIDSDTVVTGDISALYAYDVESYDLAACHEQAMVQVDEYGTYVEKCLGIDRNAYFNAGVLLINCRRFRERGVLSSFIRLLGEYNFTVTQDEDYLNVICKDHVRFLPQIWNTEIFGEIADKKEDCKILHYIMVSKPWHYADCRWGDVFWQYAKKTEFYDDIRAVLDAYTDQERARDAASAERLMRLAVSESNRPDNYLARLNAKRSPDRLAILEKIAAYEQQGRFDEDVEEDPPSRQIQPGEVDYLGKKLSTQLFRKLAYSRAKKFVYDLIDKEELVIKDIVGLKNFTSLRSGAVITCNHFHAFDSFAIQMIYEQSGHKARKKDFYRIIREGNYTSFPGFYGFLMRHYYTLPLSSNCKTMKEFVRAVDTLLTDGHFVLIYPEQSMWWNYRKPKPLKEGGFHFAAKNHVPILPCFITMRDSNRTGADGFPIQEYTIHVGAPIYPSDELRTGENAKRMMEENARIWKEIYEREYGLTLSK